jgi:hypothetical protein
LFINHKGQSKLEKEVGEAHLGDEWDSNEDSSDSNELGLATISIG